MINKEEYIKHIKDDSIRGLLIKLLDKIEIILKNHDIKTTDFLNPYEVKATVELLNNFQEINYLVVGGYNTAERNTVIMFQDYLEPDRVDIPLAALEITGNLKFKTLSHRDYLGSILSLGIKREKIGDILIHDNSCQLIVQNELKDFIKFNLEKVGNINISVEEIKLTDVQPVEINYKEVSGTVASLRLDNIISLGFKISRSEAQSLISKERVYVNWTATTKNFQEVNPGDIISLRGKGRMLIDAIQGTTKSGRIHVKFKNQSNYNGGDLNAYAFRYTE